MLQDPSLSINGGEVKALIDVFKVHHCIAPLGDDEDVVELAIAFDGRPTERHPVPLKDRLLLGFTCGKVFPDDLLQFIFFNWTPLGHSPSLFSYPEFSIVSDS